MKYITFIYITLFLFACSPQTVISDTAQPNDELLAFAKANCFFWYFKKKDYDLTDIGAISGGIVEMGSYSAEKYGQVALLVKDYQPVIATKQNIDIDLAKCFQLDTDIVFMQTLNDLKSRVF